MTVVIAVLNRKGGVGKTSVTKDLAYALVATGQRVLQVGLDPQSSLEVLAGLGFDTPAARTVARVLMPEEFADAGGLDDVVHATPWAADLIPASKALATAERALGEPGRGGANQRLARGLERLGVAERYDVVLLDCPPGMTSLTMNALVAASRVLVPTPLDFLSVAGLAVLMETVEEVREYDNPELRYLGIVGTQVDARTRHAREVRGQLERAWCQVSSRPASADRRWRTTSRPCPSPGRGGGTSPPAAIRCTGRSDPGASDGSVAPWSKVLPGSRRLGGVVSLAGRSRPGTRLRAVPRPVAVRRGAAARRRPFHPRRARTRSHPGGAHARQFA